MPAYEPFIAPPGRPPPLQLSMTVDVPNPNKQSTVYAWAQTDQKDPTVNQGMWMKTASRHRNYVCSFGVEHRRYWRRWQKGGGYPIDMRCEEHEITFV